MLEEACREKFLDLRELMGKWVKLEINGKPESGKLVSVCLSKGILLIKEAVGEDAIPITASLENVQIAP